MTLNEKTEELVERFRLNVLDYEGCSINSHISKQCALIAEEFAIGFAKWKDKNCYLVMGSESLFYVRDSEIHDDAYTRKELLEIYKKEQKL